MIRRALLGIALVAAIVSGCAGVEPTGGGAAERTFTVPLDGLDVAALMALRRMDVAVTDSRDVPDGRVVTARAGDRNVEIHLQRLTARATRMRVSARAGWMAGDRATAAEILAQTERALIENPHLAVAEPAARPGRRAP